MVLTRFSLPLRPYFFPLSLLDRLGATSERKLHSIKTAKFTNLAKMLPPPPWPQPSHACIHMKMVQVRVSFVRFGEYPTKVRSGYKISCCLVLHFFLCNILAAFVYSTSRQHFEVYIRTKCTLVVFAEIQFRVNFDLWRGLFCTGPAGNAYVEHRASLLPQVGRSNIFLVLDSSVRREMSCDI